MRIIIDNIQEKVEVTEKIESVIEKVVKNTLKHEGVKSRSEVSVTLVDNNQIQELNKEHRSIDKATDVLSFPMIDFNREKDDKYAYDRGYLMLGDIVLSLEKALEQAEEYGHSLEREIGFLCVHSTLHILGYDHDNDDNTKVMRAKEEEILLKMNLSR